MPTPSDLPRTALPAALKPCACNGAPPDAGRRRVIAIAAALGALPAVPPGMQQALAAAPQELGPQNLRPQAGDRLARADADGKPVPLTADDIQPGAKPLQAFPIDAASGMLRDGSRFNKVLLVRLDPAAMDATTLARAAAGVLAFSAVCTHAGCDVTEWLPKETALLCFCHFSKFSPLAAGQVLSGPAPRNLPCLPLTLDRGALAVAGAFSAPPGTRKAA